MYIISAAMNGQKTISYGDGLIIKALAVILMVFHHTFGFPEWYLNAPAYLFEAQFLHDLARTFRICVAVFAFLTGWLYFHHEKKSVGYSIKKIANFLLNYWIVVLPITLFAWCFCGYSYSLKMIGELIPFFQHPLMIFTWYVWFYVLMMLFFPVFSVLESDGKKIFTIPLFIILLVGMMLCARRVGVIYYLWCWFPCAMSGYFVAKFHLLEFCLHRVRSGICAAVVSLPVFGVSLYIYRCFGDLNEQNMGYLSAPLFVLAIILCGPLFHCSGIENVLRFIGKHSMNIWFFHCIFFSDVTRGVVQKAVFICDNPLWIFGSVFGISLGLSVLITPVQKLLTRCMLSPLWGKLGW